MTASLEVVMSWEIAGDRGFAFTIYSNDVNEDLGRFLAMYEGMMHKSIRLLFVGEESAKFLSQKALESIGNRFDTNSLVDIYVTRDYYDLMRFSLPRNPKDLVVIACKSTDDAVTRKNMELTKMMLDIDLDIDRDELRERVIIITDILEGCLEKRTFSRTSTSSMFEPIQFINVKHDHEISMESIITEFNEIKEMVYSLPGKGENEVEKDKCDGCKDFNNCSTDDSFACTKEPNYQGRRLA